MKNVFSEAITNLNEAEIPFDGAKAYLSQGENHQILFMEFDKDVELKEHSHESQTGFVLEGKIELLIDGDKKIYTKGDRYFIPSGVKHSGKIYAGYVDITFFNERDRYRQKEKEQIDENVEILEISEMTEEVYSLLLLADPSRKVIDEYINRGKVFGICIKNIIIGVYVLINTRPETIEIVNIAVKEDWQGKGIGKLLLKDAICKAKLMGAKVLEIGTGNSSIYQLALYQKAGFRIIGVDKDFFTIHYKEDIYENGIKCVDMIRLSMCIETL